MSNEGNSILQKIYDRSMLEYFNMLENQIRINSEKEGFEAAISNLRLQQKKLNSEKEITLGQVKAKAKAQFNNLLNSCEQWILNNAVVAPVKGILELSNFVENNHYLPANAEIGKILPQQTKLRGLMYFPSKGAGKVNLNSTLKIYPDDYPEFENGYLIGYIVNISASAYTNPNGNSFYQADVIIDPDNQPFFISNFSYRHNMSGKVEIILSNKRLLFQIFNWLDRLSA